MEVIRWLFTRTKSKSQSRKTNLNDHFEISIWEVTDRIEHVVRATIIMENDLNQVSVNFVEQTLGRTRPATLDLGKKWMVKCRWHFTRVWNSGDGVYTYEMEFEVVTAILPCPIIFGRNALQEADFPTDSGVNNGQPRSRSSSWKRIKEKTKSASKRSADHYKESQSRLPAQTLVSSNPFQNGSFSRIFKGRSSTSRTAPETVYAHNTVEGTGKLGKHIKSPRSAALRSSESDLTHYCIPEDHFIGDFGGRATVHPVLTTPSVFTPGGIVHAEPDEIEDHHFPRLLQGSSDFPSPVCRQVSTQIPESHTFSTSSLSIMIQSKPPPMSASHVVETGPHLESRVSSNIIPRAINEVTIKKQDNPLSAIENSCEKGANRGDMPFTMERFLEPDTDQGSQNLLAQGVLSGARVDRARTEQLGDIAVVEDQQRISEVQSRHIEHIDPSLSGFKKVIPAPGEILDLAPAPEAEEYWTWDEHTKQYRHIDQETHSVSWYEDSDDER
ncbi:hypothetical protein B0O99DRAFT_598347 [Bisporella sp. PMI_857]|nr:hypothetical protein B0O99DRAFT_598347 [Bisporella sp. PMI_857]